MHKEKRMGTQNGVVCISTKLALANRQLANMDLLAL